MDENTYQLIITDTLPDGQDKHQVISKLAALFKISEQKAEQLLSKPETVVKKNIDKATAEKYLAAIQKTGADCKINNTAEEELPEVIAPVTPQGAELRGFTQAPVNETQIELKQQKLALEVKEHQQLKDIDNFSEKSFCPECGTIKDSPVSVCLNCGFDPQTENSKTKNRNIRKYAAILLGASAVIIIAYLVALPFYNIYAAKSRIQNGLGLAFDTRNTISGIILETNFWPNQNIDANLEKNISNEIIESIVIGENSMFTVTVRAEALNTETSQTIIFKPKSLNDKLVWNCTQGTLENEFRPDICRKKQ